MSDLSNKVKHLEILLQNLQCSINNKDKEICVLKKRLSRLEHFNQEHLKKIKRVGKNENR